MLNSSKYVKIEIEKYRKNIHHNASIDYHKVMQMCKCFISFLFSIFLKKYLIFSLFKTNRLSINLKCLFELKLKYIPYQKKEP